VALQVYSMAKYTQVHQHSQIENEYNQEPQNISQLDPRNLGPIFHAQRAFITFICHIQEFVLPNIEKLFFLVSHNKQLPAYLPSATQY